MHHRSSPDHPFCRSAQLCRGSLCRAGRAGSHLPSATVPRLPESSDMVGTLAPSHVDGNSCSHSAHLPTSNDLYSQLLSVLLCNSYAAAVENI